MADANKHHRFTLLGPSSDMLNSGLSSGFTNPNRSRPSSPVSPIEWFQSLSPSTSEYVDQKKPHIQETTWLRPAGSDSDNASDHVNIFPPTKGQGKSSRW